MNRMLTLVVALLVAATAHGAVYKWKDSEGVIHYSDQPHPGAEEVERITIQTYRPAPAPNRPGNGSSDPAPSYVALAFVSPANDATIRDNQGNVAVQLSIAPPLRAGHSIALSIDGQRQDETVTATTFTLSNLARGTHTLLATVLDNEGNALRSSEPVTLHMVRQSELFQPQDSDQPREGPVQQAPRAPQAPRFTPDPGKSRF